MSRVSSDISVSPPPAETPVGRSSGAPISADAPSFGDHLSRAAKPAKEAAKPDAKPEPALKETAIEQTQAEGELTVEESVLIAAASLAGCELTEATTLDAQLGDARAEGADADEDSDQDPSAEELSLILAMSATPPAESIVQVDTLTLGDEAEALAATATDEVASGNQKRAAKKAPISSNVHVGQPNAPQDAPSTEADGQPVDPTNAVPVAKRTSTEASQPVVAPQVLETAEPVVVTGKSEATSPKRTSSERAKRSTNASQSEGSHQSAGSDLDATDATPATDSTSEERQVERPSPERQRPANQGTTNAATLIAVAAAPAVSQTTDTATTLAPAEGRPSQAPKQSIEATTASPASPTKAGATATDAQPTTPLRDNSVAMSPLNSTVTRRTGGPATNGSEVDRVRFVQRVARAVNASVDRGGEVTLRLSPPELGAMRLEVAIKDGVMSAHIETETSAARSVLMDNLPALRDRLAEQNVRIEKFEVEVQGSATGSLPDRTADQSNSSQGEQSGRGNRKRTDSLSEITGPTTASPRLSRDGQLNVVV